MMTELRQAVALAVQSAVEAQTGEHIALPTVEDPPRLEFGDLAVPAALELGRKLGRPPRQLAEELHAHLEEHPIPEVSRWTIAGPGYLNAFLDRGYVLTALFERLQEPPPEPSGGKVIVEHTSINPNKAAHIGHLRNACLGDTLVRVLRHRGVEVEVQNYIDDTGVQVADVVLGLIDVRCLDVEAVEALTDPFDYYCWDLYTEITGRLETDEQLQERRREVLLALEKNTDPEAGLARVVVERITRCHLATMGRLGIEYDLLVREGDIIGLDLWSEAFEKLKASEYVYYAEEGKNAGCWMMRLEGVAGFEDLAEADKVLVRSNGTATYVAKDIAYHMWKYGLLDGTFRYRVVAEGTDGHCTWRTTRGEGESKQFGGAERGVAVIDVRQAYLQRIVSIAVAALGGDNLRHRRVDAHNGGRHTHFDYEMVALTPRTAKALGIPVDETQQERSFVEMSGRRGYGVKADDLLTALVERASEEVAERNPEFSEQQRQHAAGKIAIGAARYFLVKFGRNVVIAFDLDEALNFEGETGPYLQYALVRAESIFVKMEERWGMPVEEAAQRVRRQPDGGLVVDLPTAEIQELPVDQLRSMLERAECEDLWRLILELARLERVVARAGDLLEVSGLAKYAFGVAQEFNRFYHGYPILREKDPAERGLRILLAYAFRVRFSQTLSLLGIPLPDRM